MRAAIVLAMLVIARVALAAPAADLVVYWAPPGTAPAIRDRVAADTRAAGAGFLDRSPAPAAAEDLGALLRRGRGAYDALQFEEAVAVLDAADDAATRDGGLGLTRTELGDLYLYRGLAWIQRGDDDRGWDDLVTAARLDPTRVLDPVRFPPRAVDAFVRARTAIERAPRGHLVVTGAAACTLTVDGVVAAAAGGAVEVATGPHWVQVACANRPPWGRRVEVGAAGATVAVPALAPLADEAILVQARASGARAVVAVAVLGELVTLRTLAADGRELDRRTTAAAPADAGAALAALLAPPRAGRPRWYRRNWVWAAAAATVVAAVLVPVIVSGDDGARPIVVRPVGLPW